MSGIDPGTIYDFLEPEGQAKLKIIQRSRGRHSHSDAYNTMWFKYPLSIPYLRIAGAADCIESLDIHMSEALTGQASPRSS